MSYGRDNDGLPGQSRGSGSYDAPGPSSPGGRRIPGGKKAGGGGILMLLIVGAVMFFFMRGKPAPNQGQQDGTNKQQQAEDNTFDPWRNPVEGAADDKKDRIDIPGIGGDQKKSDRVENRDGWSMEDANENDKKDNGLPLSNKSNQKNESDEVKNSDGWSVKDANEKDKKRDQ